MNASVKTIIFTLSLSFIFACSSEKGQLEPKKAPIVITTEVKYSSEIVPIFTTYCTANAGCHGAGANNPNLTLYSEAKVYAGSINNRVIIVGDMPQYGSTPLPDLEKAKLKKWLDDGAPNN